MFLVGVLVPQGEVTDFGVVCPIGPVVSKAYFEEKCISTHA